MTTLRTKRQRAPQAEVRVHGPSCAGLDNPTCSPENGNGPHKKRGCWSWPYNHKALSSAHDLKEQEMSSLETLLKGMQAADSLPPVRLALNF